MKNYRKVFEAIKGENYISEVKTTKAGLKFFEVEVWEKYTLQPILRVLSNSGFNYRLSLVGSMHRLFVVQA